mmetsp:Transcript_13698/g.20158  ORF Transcript_13698/g.20158 Transcript_13698/m.20158 type:complete len:382 (+) Transcript_13698:71-1216(+)
MNHVGLSLLEPGTLKYFDTLINISISKPIVSFFATHAPWSQCYKLLSSCGVDGNAAIQIRLGATHLHGDPKPLQHLVSSHPEKVHPHHSFAWALTNHLHFGLLLLGGVYLPGTVVQVREGACVDLEVVLAKLLPGLRLGVAAGADGGVREDHGGDQVVVGLDALHAVEQAVRQAPAGSDSHGRELDLPTHVPQGKHALRRGLLQLVSDDVAPSTLLLLLHLGCWQVQSVHCGLAPNGHEDDVEPVVRGVVLQVQGQLAVLLLFHRLDVAARVDFEAGAGHFCVEGLLDDGVELAQGHVPPHKQVRERAQGVQDPRHLHCNITSSNDCHLHWLLFNVKEPITVDTVFDARYLWHVWVATSCNQDVVCCVFFFPNLNGLRAHK